MSKEHEKDLKKLPVDKKKITISPPIPPVPKKKKAKPILEKTVEEIKNPLIKLRSSKLEDLYWRVSWLQFVVLAISFWTVVISSYDPVLADMGSFGDGFDKIKIIAAISGTLTSFTNVVLGGMIKQFNKQIDLKQEERDKEKESADKNRRKMEVSEVEGKKKDKRILSLETQLLQLSLKMQQFAEHQIKEAYGS